MGGLLSTTGVDYSELQAALQDHRWQKADHETWKVMTLAVGKASGSHLDDTDFNLLPCDDLKIIDQLWVEHSQGQFGFSIQKQIYLETGNPLDGLYHEETFRPFGTRVQWIRSHLWNGYNDINFDLSAAQGHLPLWGWQRLGQWEQSFGIALRSEFITTGLGLGWGYLCGGWVAALSKRLAECQL